MLLLQATHVHATTWRSLVGARRESWVDAALTRASRRLQKKTATAAPLALSLDRGCRFSLFSAKPCTPMLNFFARSGLEIEKIDSLCPGRGIWNCSGVNQFPRFGARPGLSC